jgi:hypothetical protein
LFAGREQRRGGKNANVFFNHKMKMFSQLMIRSKNVLRFGQLLGLKRRLVFQTVGLGDRLTGKLAIEGVDAPGQGRLFQTGLFETAIRQ